MSPYHVYGPIPALDKCQYTGSFINQNEGYPGRKVIYLPLTTSPAIVLVEIDVDLVFCKILL